MTLFLGYGEPGVGKTSQHVSLCKMLPDSIYLCLETKDNKTLERQSDFQFRMIEQFDEEYMEDPILTLSTLQMELKDIINSGKYHNIVVDGVSDIRKYAIDEWMVKDNRARSARGERPRTSISGENLSAWSEIGDRVKGIIRPLANWSNVKRTNIFFTAQMKDNYLNNKKVGKLVNIGEWLEYDVDVKCYFTKDKDGGYEVTFAKVPNWAIVCEDTVEIKRDGFIALLAERGLLT